MILKITFTEIDEEATTISVQMAGTKEEKEKFKPRSEAYEIKMTAIMAQMLCAITSDVYQEGAYRSALIDMICREAKEMVNNLDIHKFKAKEVKTDE